MAKRRPAASSAEIVHTLEGHAVPAAELVHITPHFRQFAVPIDSLKRDPENAKLHTDRDLPQTAASLKRFGQQHMVHFDPATRTIKVGSGRHEAGQTILGWKWIAAVPSNLSPAELEAFGLADNLTADNSEYDIEVLRRKSDELKIELPDLDLGEFGLTTEALDALDDGDFESAHRFAPKKPDEEPPGEEQSYPAVFKLIVICSGEKDQTAKIKKLEELGWEFTAPNVT